MAKQSLASKAGALSTELKLPGIFSAPAERIVGRAMAPYISFAHPKRADEWSRIQGKYKHNKEGAMYLVESKEVTHLEQAKLALIVARQYWTRSNAAGELLEVSFEEVPDMKEHVLAVVLCYLEDRCVPANVEFRTTKCGGAKKLSDALEEASDRVAWGSNSQAHADSCVLEQPFARYYGILSISPPRTSKTSGLPYTSMNCQIFPTSTPEWRLFSDLSTNEDSAKALELAAQRFEYKLKEIEAKA